MDNSGGIRNMRKATVAVRPCLGGFISDVLIRLCRAAAETYADHAQLGKPPPPDKRLEAAETAHPDGPPKPPEGGWPVIPGTRSNPPSPSTTGPAAAGGGAGGAGGGAAGAAGVGGAKGGGGDGGDSTAAATAATAAAASAAASASATAAAAADVLAPATEEVATAAAATAAAATTATAAPVIAANVENKAGPLSVLHVAAAVSRVLPKELALHASAEARDALEATVGLWRGPGPPPTALVFAPDRVRRAAETLAKCAGAGAGRHMQYLSQPAFKAVSPRNHSSYPA